MSTNRKKDEAMHRQKSQSKASTDGRSEMFDEFGIMRAEGMSYDSTQNEEAGFSPTDDDLSQQILDATASENESPSARDLNHIGTTSDSEPLLELSATSGNVGLSDFHIQLEDLTADLTGCSEDFSRASDAGGRTKRSQESGSPHQEETESLTEFEEIERLIQANTVADSDDDLSDIPEDLEQMVLSGRKSRESYKSDTRSEKGILSLKASNHSDTSSTSSSRRSVGQSKRKAASGSMPGHHDTGYMSEGALTNSPGPSNVNLSQHIGGNSFPQPSAQGNSTTELSPAQNQQNESFLSTSGKSHSELNQVYSPDARTSDLGQRSSSSSSTDSDQETPKLDETNNTDLDVTLDRFMVPTTRIETNQPDSLVATFGTTQDFEVLLQQQLEDMGTEEILDGSGRLTGTNAAVKEENRAEQRPLTSTRRKKLPDEPRERGKSPARSSRRSSPRESSNKGSMQVRPQAKNKLQLSSSNKSSPRENLTSSNPGYSSRSTRPVRSPAASRARRKSNAANGRKSTLHRESSTDDMSVRSDISRTELRSKLKEEALSRKREEDLVRELQSNYDSLLMKYAQAENTIDHLRLGAKINIFAAVPRANPEDPTLSFEEAELRKQEEQENQQFPQESGPAMYQGGGNNFQHHRTPSGAHSSGSKRDSMVESSLQLPAAATTEFLKVALQLQAKDLQDKIESLNTLLNEGVLDPIDKGRAMENIEATLRNLEKDYLNAIDEHAAEQRKLSMATGGGIEQEFDPSRSMERDIGSLGDMVQQLQRRINEESLHQMSPPPPASSRRNFVDEEVPSSPEGDVDSKFNQLLLRYNNSLPADDGHTTALSQYLSSEEDDVSPQPLSSRYLQPTGNDTSTTSQTQYSPTPVSSPQTNARQRFNSSFSSMGDSIMSTSPTSPTRRQQTRLPRPVGKGGRERRAPSSEDRKSKHNTDKGTDSGFVGSESSRQSASATPLQPAKVKLVSRPPAEVISQPTPKPRGHPEKRDRTVSGDTTSTMTTNDRFPKHRPQASYIDKVGIFKPPPPMHDDSLDDLSTTSTVRDALRPRHPSLSCSTSTVPSQATAVMRLGKAPAYPHGSKSGTSVKSRDSKRSIASTSKDSTLDVIRGEIARLRDEIKAAKSNEKENVHPRHMSTPRRPPWEQTEHADPDTLQLIRDDIKALKDEVNKKSRKPDDVDQASLRSADLASGRSRSSERGRRSRRSRSLGRDDVSEASSRRNESSPETTSRTPRTRSRSQTRTPWQGGYWTYVPPAPVVAPGWVSPTPMMARTYTRAPSPVQTMHNPTPVYRPPPVVHAAPIIGPPPTVVYLDPQQAPTTGRVYVPSPMGQSRVYPTPSKPRASVYISPKHSVGRSGVRKASVYIVDESDEEQMRRSHLSLRRSSSMSRLHSGAGERKKRGGGGLLLLPDSRLDDSMERAERSAEEIRSHSRQMYRSLRNDVYRSQLMAETM